MSDSDNELDRPDQSEPQEEGFPIPPFEDYRQKKSPEPGEEGGEEQPEAAGEEPESQPEGEGEAEVGGVGGEKRRVLSESEESLRRSQVASLLGRAETEEGGQAPATLPDEEPEDEGFELEPEAEEGEEAEVVFPPGVPVGMKPGEAAAEEPAAKAPPRPAAGVALTDLLGHHPPETPEVSAPGAGWINVLLGLAALIALACGILLVCVHINDRYHVNMASGVWIALAQAADDGVLYPPLFDEATQTYGGTRYMPLTILLHTGAAQFTGEYLTSGKIIGCASAVLMLLAVLTVLISLRCPPLLAMGLTGLIIVSPTGLEAITSIRGDALPIFIQLLALGLFVRKGERTLPMVILVGALCALAVVAKISAVWGLMAIGLWLLAKDRKRLLFFAAGFVGLLVIAAAILWLLTGGRFFTSVLALTFAGSSNLGAIVLVAPQRLVEFTTEWAPICWALLPLAAAGLVLRLANRRFTPYHLALLCCLAILLVIYADWGVGENHVLDLLILSVILVGDLAGQIPRQRRGMAVAHAGMAMIAVIGIPLAFLHKPLGADEKFLTTGQDVLNGINLLAGRQVDVDYNPQPLEGMIAEDELILSEDPYVPVSLDRAPAVLDGFMLKRMDEGPIGALVGRISNREFGKIILLREMDAGSWWYRELFFGEAVAAAIDANYVLNDALTEQAGGYYIYEPRVTALPEGGS